MFRWLNERLKWWRINRAERLVWRYGYGVYFRAYVDEAAGMAGNLRDYSHRSGHLTRGFQAGKRVQRDTDEITARLTAARLLAENHSPRRHRGRGVSVAPLVVLLLARILASGGSRTW